MTTSVNEKLNRTFQLLLEYKFTTINDINDDYKCGICKNIINNAHQAICGCNFCYECINRFIENGGIKCPGNKDECQSENLLNLVTNYQKNIQISKFIVKCPNKSCFYECKLIEMEDHLRFCSMRSVRCSFTEIGCQHEEISNEKLKEHFMSNIENHSKILIDLIGQLKNEVRELKENDERNRSEIEMLKMSDNKKDEAIKLLRSEINIFKQENQELKTLMKNINNMSDKLDKIDIEINERCENEISKSLNEEMQLLKIDKSKLTDRLKVIDQNCLELNEKFQEVQQLKIENQERNEKINKMDIFMNMRHDGQLRWQIGKINEIKWMWSEFFYDIRNPYKMQLGLDNTNNKLNIRLFINSGAFDAVLKWPMQANITIRIRSLNNNIISKSIEKSYEIRKPENNSYKSGDDISFAYADCAQEKLIDVICELVCIVKFQQNL